MNLYIFLNKIDNLYQSHWGLHNVWLMSVLLKLNLRGLTQEDLKIFSETTRPRG